jgi:hypothetical protein
LLASGIASCSRAQQPCGARRSQGAALPGQPDSRGSSIDSGSGSLPESAEQPLPLHAGSDAGPANGWRRALERHAPRTRSGARSKNVVAQCKQGGQRVCGELKVRASEDGKNIRIALGRRQGQLRRRLQPLRDVTPQLGGIGAVRLPGSDTTLESGLRSLIS